MLSEQVKEKSIGGDVALPSNFVKNATVVRVLMCIVKVVMIIANVKESVLFQPIGLMYLKVKAD